MVEGHPRQTAGAIGALHESQNPQFRFVRRRSPLHRAARVGSHDEIRRLAAAGADLNSMFDMHLDPGGRTQFATPLMVAAGSGDGATVETIRLLLDLGADPTFVNKHGDSAAAFACQGLGWNYKPGGD